MSIFGSIIEGAASLGGALLGSRASSDAAQTAADASEKAARIYAQQMEAAREEFRRAAQRGIAELRPMRGSADILTPSQEIARDDLRRGGIATLAASGLRGAGRAGVGQVLDADRRFLADAYDRNRARGDQARGAIANTEIGAGNQIGGTYGQQGAMAAQMAQNAGLYQAGSQLDQGQLWGGALGSIGSIIADEMRGRSAGTPPTA